MLRSLRTTLSRDDFKERVYNKSKAMGSKITATSSLVNFDEFFRTDYCKEPEEIIEKLRASDGDEKYNFLQDFIHYMGRMEHKPRTVRTYFSWCKSYLRSQGIKTYNEDIKALIRFPTEIKESPKPLTLDIIRKLLDNSKEKRKALYLTLLSSGMRLGEALSLRKRDFNLESNPIKITIPGKFTKRRETRETYISSEAREILLRSVKRLKDDDLIFAESEDPIQAENSEERAFMRLRERCGLIEKYSDEKRYVVNIHSMRAWFSTKASKEHGEEYAHSLDGHTGYLPQYYRLTSEERVQMYRELEPSLLIYGSEELAKTQKEIQTQLQFLKDEVSRYKQTTDYLMKTRIS